MTTNKKSLSTWTLGLMNVAIVVSLQVMTGCAIHGSALISFYTIAILTFFLPSLFIIADLVASSPVTGGSYIWIQRAFGKRWGFFTVCIQWLCNLIWYPTVFSLIATSMAYLFAPDLATNETYIFITILALFWGLTLINCFGIKISGLISATSSFFGIIIPSLVLIGFGITWFFGSHPTHISFEWNDILPDFKDSSQFAFLTQIIISLVGMEMAFVHAGDVRNPSRSIPRALIFSAILILTIVILAPLSIGMVIEPQKINVISGLFDAFKIYVTQFGLPQIFYFVIIALIFIGNCGNVSSWMISSTRSMHIACEECDLPAFLKKTNRFDAPIGVLISEAILFSIFAVFFLFFESISSAYWIFLTLASQVALIYYMLIFAAAVKIKKDSNPLTSVSFIPGGLTGTKVTAGIAGVATLAAALMGFFPPMQQDLIAGSAYPFVLLGGIAVILAIPCLLLLVTSKTPESENIENFTSPRQTLAPEFELL